MNTGKQDCALNFIDQGKRGGFVSWVLPPRAICSDHAPFGADWQKVGVFATAREAKRAAARYAKKRGWVACRVLPVGDGEEEHIIILNGGAV